MKHIIIGGPRTGKSTYARELRAKGIKTYCTDPLSLVKEPEYDVTYLPEEMGRWSDASQYVADAWFTMPGEWCIEGIATVRALRKFLAKNGELPNDFTLSVLKHQYGELLDGQKRMAKAVGTIWEEVKPKLFPGTTISIKAS